MTLGARHEEERGREEIEEEEEEAVSTFEGPKKSTRIGILI